MQKTQRKDHPHQAVIQDIIIEINKNIEEGHEIMLSIDGNDSINNATGGKAKLYRDCKLFDSFDRRHRNNNNAKLYLGGSHKIDFIFCTVNILATVKKCGMIGFNEITTSDHCGLFMDVSRDVLLNDKITSIPFPLEKKVKSNSPTSVNKYKKYLQQQITKNNIEVKIEKN